MSSSSIDQRNDPFTSHDNLCGSRLETLVCRGHCLITNVLQLSNEIPSIFRVGYELDDFASQYQNNSFTTSTGTTKPIGGVSVIGDVNTNGFEESRKDVTSSFFGSSVRNIFTKPKHQFVMKKIRSQAPSYKQYKRIINNLNRGSSAGNSNGSAQYVNDEMKYSSILVDFSYLSNPDKFDENQNNNKSNQVNNANMNDNHQKLALTKIEQEHLERDFALKYNSTLKTYYTLFQNIHSFFNDVNTFITDLDQGHFLQYTLSKLLLLEKNEARQLLCEILYLCASLMILLDLYMPGEIRERIIIAHFRFCNSNDDNYHTSTFESLCKMFQRCAQDDSGSLKSKRDDNHGGRKPCIQSELLSRISIPTTFVNRIIECLVSVDLYPSQSYAFPSFHHRSSKFGQQSAMLLIILFFDECSLKHNTNLMRQVVDKFIHDTWIIPLYNGSVIDLSLEWNQQYPAAMNAINHVIASENVRQLNYTTMKMILSNLDEVQRYLAPKILTTAFLLDYGSSILDFLRGANAALRWQILHRNSHLCPKAEDDDTSAMLVDEHDILSLILLVSQLEVQLVEAYQQILLKKEAIWSNCKVVIIDKVDCLSKYFFGNDSLKVAEKDDDLGKWFENMVDEITLIDFNADKTGGQIQMTMEALDEVKQLDLIDSSLPSIAIIEEAQKNLVHMAKVANIEHDICETINFISDFTYAREILESLVPLLHSKSMKDPKSVTLLRAFFIKMGKDIPNLRLHSLAERQQNDLNYVTEFHEAAMLSFVKEILDVIPITIFSTLAHIADEKSLALLPAKIEADRLIEYLHFKDRYNVSKITYELSILTKGIFSMKKTCIGNMEINPKQLLEEGLRKELVRQYSMALHNTLQFHYPDERSKKALIEHSDSFHKLVQNLSHRIEGFQRSMIWLQDFLDIDGLKIFIDETSRVVKANVQHEIVHLIQRSAMSHNQIDNGVHIPLFSRSGSDKRVTTFMGRILNALLQLTDVKYTLFSNSFCGWYFPSGEQVCGMRTILIMRNALGVNGLLGLDKLLCNRISNELSRLIKFYHNIQSYGAILEQFRDAVYPEWRRPQNGIAIYELALKKIMKLLVPLNKYFCRIGQLQLLRKLLWNELRLGVDTKVSHSCATANQDFIANCKNKNELLEANPNVEAFSDIIAACGLANPMSTIFLQTNSMDGLPSLITLFAIFTMRELTFDSDFGSLSGRDNQTIDGWTIIAGIATMLRQINSAYTKSVFALLGQYVVCVMQNNTSKGIHDEVPRFADEVRNILIFMKQLQSLANLEASVVFDHIPSHIIEMIEAKD